MCSIVAGIGVVRSRVYDLWLHEGPAGSKKKAPAAPASNDGFPDSDGDGDSPPPPGKKKGAP
jgi:hypothetical protein